MTNFLSETKGFTPVIDVLAQELSLMAAVVYGVVWRYCQMEKRVCVASLETIANRVGIDRSTAKRHIKELCAYGYLKDLTPDLRNRPHTYADTGRVKIEALITVKTGEAESPAPDSVGGQKTTVGEAENPMKKAFKTEEETLDWWDLWLKTEEAQQKEGQWTMPTGTKDGDTFIDKPVNAFAEICAKIDPDELPITKRKKWAKKLQEIAIDWSTKKRIIEPEDMETAIRRIPDSPIHWKTYNTPFMDSFAEDIGPLLLGTLSSNAIKPKVIKLRV